MKNFTDYIINSILAVIVLALVLLFLPLYVLFWPINYISTKIADRQLRNYLLQLGDKNFFCYNNRADAKDFIEKELLPRLDKKIELIYLNGRKPKSRYETDKISSMLYKLKQYKRFPHLLKVRDGEIMDTSINNEFFNTMRQNKSIEKLAGDINEFFGLRRDKNAA